MSRRIAEPELKPIYARPQLDRRTRQAERAFREAAFRGKRNRPANSAVDPLWLRLGMRASNIQSRAGWVVSNPLLDQTLRRCPDLDSSLPGIAWLRELYRWHMRDLVCLPRTLAVIEGRYAPAELVAVLPSVETAAPEVERDQLELFA